MSEELQKKRKEFWQIRNELEQKRREMEEKLANEFFFMRRGDSYKEQQEANGKIHDLFSAFGCEIGTGWTEILRGLCTQVTAVYEKAGLPVDIVVDQVKEKFGRLRYYYHHKEHDPSIHAIDVLGGPSLRIPHGNSEIHQEVAKIVEKWETLSGTVCESCGAPGTLRKDIGYRVQTLCDSCYMQIKQKFVERESKRRSEDGK